MKNNIKFQWNLMIHSKEFKIALSAMLGLCLYSYVSYVHSFWKADLCSITTAVDLLAISSLSNVGGIIPYFLSFVIVLPFSTSFIEDKYLRNENFIYNRTSKKDYLLSKMTVCFAGGSLIVVIPFFVNLVLCALTFPKNLNYILGSYGTHNYAKSLVGSNQIYQSIHPELSFLKLYCFSPWLYNALYILMLSVFSGFLSVFVLAFSFVFPRHKVVLFLPLYIIFRIMKVVDTACYSAAVIDEKKVYSNWNITDYFLPYSFHGHNVFYAVAFIGVIALFIAASYCYEVKKEEL